MTPTNIPGDINIEALLSYFQSNYPEGQCKATFGGPHNRNAYNDLIKLEGDPEKNLTLTIGRASLYHLLPEQIFHPIDRFDKEKENFENEYEAQKKEKKNALDFFAPVDQMLLQLRMMVRQRISEYAETNKALIDILAEKIPENQKNNRFVKLAIPFLPYCKNIRGDMTCLTLMLRKIFMEEGIHIRTIEETSTFVDSKPRYKERLDNNPDSLYLGNTFDELTKIYEIEFWSDDECNEHFLHFVDEVEIFRQFLQDYFIAVEDTLRFNITHDSEPVRLSDDTNYYYMNYNMNI